MEPALGPLEYVKGSHHWGEGRVGSANQFFDVQNRHALLYDAARQEGMPSPETELDIVRVDVKAGGCGIHNGRLWHGSGKNESLTKPRRGLGIHFVPANAVFREVDGGRTIAHAFAAEDGSPELPGEHFPVTWTPGLGLKEPEAAEKGSI